MANQGVFVCELDGQNDERTAAGSGRQAQPNRCTSVHTNGTTPLANLLTCPTDDFHSGPIPRIRKQLRESEKPASRQRLSVAPIEPSNRPRPVDITCGRSAPNARATRTFPATPSTDRKLSFRIRLSTTVQIHRSLDESVCGAVRLRALPL